MCGIAGVCNSIGVTPEPRLLEDMNAIMRYRGPDECGAHVGPGIGLANVRLSIIDLGGGHQPMHNEDMSLWITFNGEIFNYIELREGLIARGYRFNTDSDTEVILHLYEDQGEDCVRSLNGQWAFAIWDAQNRKLFLSRDRLGVRPLFYSRSSDELVFGSEIKSIFVHPNVSRELDLLALDEIFTFWCTVPPRTIFKDVSELPPGHSLTFQSGELHVHQYWSLAFDGVESNQQSEQKYVEELTSLLTDAVRIRLRSDVPVGSYLSGGLDSTIVTSLIRQFSNTKLETFSVAFSTPALDESFFQQEAVDFLHTTHQSVRCGYDDIAYSFPEVIWHSEKPIIRTAPGPMYLLSGLVQDAGMKVVLTGEGADEVFAGYDIYKEDKIRRFWMRQPESKRRARLLRGLYPYQRNLQKQSDAYLQSFFSIDKAKDKDPFFSHVPRWVLTSRLKLFFSDEVVSEIGSYDCLDDLAAQLPERFNSWPPLCRAQYLETTLLLPGYILSSQGDRVAMAHSVEARHPFLDYRIVELGARMPPNLKMKVLDEKYILKRTFGDRLPRTVVNRPKQPYRAPDGKSFFSNDSPEYVRELVSPARIASTGVFDANSVTALVNKFTRGDALGVKDDMALVGILSTQLIMDQFVEHFRNGGFSCATSKLNCTALS